MSAMTEAVIAIRLAEIIERAEFAGRMDGIAKATRSSRRAKDARESSDLSSRYVRQMADDLVKELTK
jgi:hypothetical protein